MGKITYNPINSSLVDSAEEVFNHASRTLLNLAVNETFKRKFLDHFYFYIRDHPNIKITKSEDVYKEKLFGPLEVINLTTMAITAIAIKEGQNKEFDMTELLDIQSRVLRKYIIRDQLILGVSDIQYKKEIRN